METKNPLPDADLDFVIDLVTYGVIDYSFTDYSEGLVVDFKYLCNRLDSDTMIHLTDKIKDLITDALLDLKEEEESEEDDEK